MASDEAGETEFQVSVLEAMDSGIEDLLFESNEGAFQGHYHPLPGAEGAVLWVGGVGGGLEGPAQGMYPRLAGQLKRRGLASLRLDFRHPGDFEPCVTDVLAGVGFLRFSGHGRIALVGHSFGGAVVITAGAASEEVAVVAALSSQTWGTGAVDELSPRPVLFLHGGADVILPDGCSRDLYRRAREPKTLKLYAGCSHGLDECREQVDAFLGDWLVRALAAPPQNH